MFLGTGHRGLDIGFAARGAGAALEVLLLDVGEVAAELGQLGRLGVEPPASLRVDGALVLGRGPPLIPANSPTALMAGPPPGC